MFAQVNDDYCKSTEPALRPPMIFDGVTIHFNGGASLGHTFKIDLCDLSGRFVVQYGPVTAKNKTEVEFTAFVARPSWTNNTSVVASLVAQSPSLGMTVVISCLHAGSDTPSASAVVSPDLQYQLLVQSPSACADVVGRYETRVLSLAEILITAFIGAILIGICYSVGYRIVVEKRRGLEVCPCFGGPQYEPVARDESEVEVVEHPSF